jgi:hypothetical protein
MSYPSPDFRKSLIEWAARIDFPIKELIK